MAIESCNSEYLRSPAPGRSPESGRGETPAFIVMAGGQEHDPPTEEILEQADELREKGQLLVLHKGQPFGELFPHINVLIGQGGLGVSSEALRAGVPIITSGILLLDQRWWAARVNELGCGSMAVRVERLMTEDTDMRQSRIVRLLHEALGCKKRVSDDLTWGERCQEVSQAIAQKTLGDEDGITLNAKEVYLAGTRDAAILEDAYSTNRGCCNCIDRQMRCCYRCIERCLRGILLRGLPMCFYVLIVFFAEILCCGPCRRRCCPGKTTYELEMESETDEEIMPSYSVKSMTKHSVRTRHQQKGCCAWLCPSRAKKQSSKYADEPSSSEDGSTSSGTEAEV
eukprot:TRINITY_DN50223_c0_g1_i1.p1 TRINITY_DN50223_c0_g1~~TRINITY_DN50223_c0_g1_i1.p1  ORF type:complete len:396 (-),score=60.56 TRINITY_DN50223_c0_g1_i1:94-1116(-)